MPTLADMKTRVREAAGRGNSLDSFIPFVLEDAVRYIQGQHTFKEMEQWVEFQLDPNDSLPDRIGLPSDVKHIYWIRLKDEDSWVWLVQVWDPKNIIQETGLPQGYWMDGRDQLVLDATPDKVYDGELYYASLEPFPSDDNADHWLFNKAPQLCVAGAMIWLGAYMRETEGHIYGMWKSIFERELRDLIMQDEELRASSNHDWQMNDGYKMPWE
jgi:hypothetical protein